VSWVSPFHFPLSSPDAPEVRSAAHSFAVSGIQMHGVAADTYKDSTILNLISKRIRWTE
jgi:hypothetical protein